MDISECNMSTDDTMNVVADEIMITTDEGVHTEAMTCEPAIVVYKIEQDPNLKVGSRFPDYQSFAKALKKYSLANNVVYTTVKSASIRRRNKILKEKQLRLCDPKLKVTWISLGCKHFGLKRTTGKGIRLKQRSFKTGCNSQLHLSLDTISTSLVVTQFITEHNHSLSPDMAESYPERRRLSLQETLAIEDRLRDPQLKAKELQEIVRSTLNKSISTKDIHNLRAKMLRPLINPAYEEQLNESTQLLHSEDYTPSTASAHISRRESLGDNGPMSPRFRSLMDSHKSRKQADEFDVNAVTIKHEEKLSERRNQWITNCDNDALLLRSSKQITCLKVCQRHFTEDCFTNTLYTKIHRLSVPTLDGTSVVDATNVVDATSVVDGKKLVDAASDGEEDDYQCVEYLEPTYMDDEVVLTETMKAVDKVNESWKCVYKLLEADNAALKRDNVRLREQLSKLKQSLCERCGSREGK